METLRQAVGEESIAKAAELLTAGQLVAFPTETVYGLGARADDAAAVRRIYSVKGRPIDKALSVLVPDVAIARTAAAHWPASAERLARAFWPGPLTLVVRRAGLVVDEVVASGATVALRVPSHPAALDLLRRCAFPVAAPSANLSGQPPATSADEVMAGFAGRIPLVLDGGSTEARTASTVVDLTRSKGRGVILRPGVIPAEALQEHVALS
ncbi:MAG: threonylcarbamoyl-AMP synthase [Deltaproteobacteria bacterium]|nr:threonylcarbamoyl-AMP synthase [Deltaproteobacteria bacterium]